MTEGRAESPGTSGSRGLTLELRALAVGEPSAWPALMERVYGELLALSRSCVGRGTGDLSATQLVHELFIRFASRGAVSFESRRHFFGAAVRAMQQIVVDLARARGAAKRGGGRRAENLSGAEGVVDGIGVGSVGAGGGVERSVELDRLQGVLEELSLLSPRRHELVLLRVFGGLTMSEVCAVMGISESTGEREWRIARAFLQARLGSS